MPQKKTSKSSGSEAKSPALAAESSANGTYAADTTLAADSFSITRALNIQGWGHLDAVLLAALATEAPLLLVGPHGTGKSLLIERLAQALGLSMRHYNASLLNYDDLVGIPIPEEGNDSLRFIATPDSIWDAEFVFFDEISRCRPDLQNKMFPIIHERRVAGILLGNLRYRWSAMNPPAPDEPDMNATNANYYLGSEPLDPALADRFPYVVPVPDWKQLSKQDRRRLVSWQDEFLKPGERVTNDELPPLLAMANRCAALIPELERELDEWLSDYILLVMDLLEKAQLPQSPRRANMLARSVVAVHAARLVLEGDEADLETSAEIALLFGLPQSATEVPPSEPNVVAVHKQAWEIASLMEDDSWRQVLEETDSLRRILLAEDLGFDTISLSRLVTQALGAESSEARRMGIATALFLAFRMTHSLSPSAWEPLAQLAGRILHPRPMNFTVGPGVDTNNWKAIKGWLSEHEPQKGEQALLERNFVLAGYPELWRKENWHEALNRFQQDLALFGVGEEKQS
ncbi:MAG: AAA family ATPase [Anaerolineaceae bacterium]|nr:AAA family ATPase [Anaerolineaceae bacterium]